ncbi:MAG TPA: hypothetical protein VMU01_06575, partial [Rhizomicrobium sp.]|nr:hypothetical protein [Rhizomicrobium sp.]
MMKLLRAPALFSIAPLLLLSGCPNNAVNTPVPDQPSIASGNLIGQRECNSITIDGTTYSFVCDPLPTKVATGWLLAPGTHTTANGTHLGNDFVTLQVTVPSFTNLSIDFVPTSGPAVVQTQIQTAPNQPAPKPLGAGGQVGVQETDNGTLRTWTLSVQLASCSAEAQLNIFDLDASGARTTNPLVVYFLRDPTQFSCTGTGGTGSNGTGGTGSTGNGGTGSTGTGGTTMHEVLEFAGAFSATNWGAVDVSSITTPPASLAGTNIALPFPSAGVVSCAGAMVTVGAANGGQVAVYSSTSAQPIPQRVGQLINTGFGGIGAIKLVGNTVIAGEANGSKVVLIDISNPNHFVVGTPFTTSIQSIGSLDMAGSKAVVAGPNDNSLQVLNISGLTATSAGTINPGLGIGLTLSLSGTVVAVAQVPPTNGAAANPNTPVALVDINTKATLATATTSLGGISSLGSSGMKVVAGSANNLDIALIDFTPS